MHTLWDESRQPRTRERGRRLAAAVALCAAGLSVALPAQAESMEERLRAQLRSTTQQLQQLQSEQAQVNAAKAAAEAQRDAAQKELVALRSQLASAKGQAEKLAGQQEAVMESAQAQVAASHAQLGKFKGAYDELLTLSRAKEAERQTLARTLAQRDTEAKACIAKNREMYEAGKEILNAYERIGTGGILAMKQPFAGSARVKFEEQAQAYGDRLYDAQVGATAPAAPAAQP
ncbi:DNA repair protein [Achromobacter xylosoxidans]|uniref:DNA repair protein n=1 Tax=Alcaligenes xylosoxydans xylosoxydans TaxID=85698 RepID=UPI0022B932C9|nr:DNA repair protein [Achromobacter xylosoxidans]MCZ8390251.1 DNA repair protein [Achromobacter xylosoxidans]